MSSLEEIIRKKNKEFKMDNLTVTASITPEYERMPTGALGFDFCLGGGIPLGRICMFSGLQHSGKSSAGFMAIGAYQRRFPDRPCVFVDVEHAADLKFQARMNGVDLSRLQYVNPIGLSGEQILDLIVEFQKADNIGMIVLDSLPALIPGAVMENDLTKDLGMRGTIAKKLYPFLACMAGMVNEKNNSLILINQVRQTGTTFTGAKIYSEPCGNAPQYYSSICLRFGTRRWIKDDDMDACKTTNGEGATGFRLCYKVVKNKVGDVSKTSSGFISYDYNRGLMWDTDLLEVALTFDFIHRVNNLTYELIDLESGEVIKDEDGNDLRGKKADLIGYIKAHPAFQSWYIDMLNKYISKPTEKNYGCLLDERAMAEIDAQERAVNRE